jgi:hypothetical protein
MQDVFLLPIVQIALIGEMLWDKPCRFVWI